MSSNQTQQRSPEGAGLAVASFVCGAIAFLSGVVWVAGVFGLAGVALGAMHLDRRQRSDGLAWAGIVFSILGILISVGIGMVFQKLTNPVLDAIGARMGDHDAATSNGKGTAAPELVLNTLNGDTIRLSDLKGKRVVLDFWATWCKPCVAEIPHFIELRKDVSADELMIIGISGEDPETLGNFVKMKKINYPIVSSREMPPPFDSIDAIPTTVFIDRNGIIQEIATGYHSLNDLKRLATADDYVASSKSPNESK